MMITDQEESEKYLKIAQKYLLNDDHRNALQYLYKSQHFHPSTYVEDMIGKVEQLIIVSEENGRFESKRRREDEAKSKLEQSKCNDDGDCVGDRDDVDDEDDVAIRPEFSDDQLQAVQRIRECKDFYQILGATKDANDQELKKQYRRLALQFHPDKNKAPGASDAFKAISSAFEVLGDPDKRRHYDLYGTNDPSRVPKKRTDIYAENNYYPRFTGQNMGPEEIFHVFFGNAHRMYGARNHWYTDRTSSDSSSSSSTNEPSGLTVFLQIFPVIVFILMSLMSSLLIYDPVYSLTRTTRYPFIRKTSDLHVPYFVRANFERDYKHNLRKIEEDVNQEFIRDLKTRCFKEKNYRENLIWKAKNIGDTTFEERARRMKTPSCTELQDLQQLIDDKT